MTKDLVKILECPHCRGDISLAAPMTNGVGQLICSECKKTTPIRRGIPRFAATDSYTASFSDEWNRFRTTQLDSHNRSGESEERFRQSWDEPLEHLRGKRVLDGGCGMGRFAEVALRHGAHVVGVDLSYAIDAARENLKSWQPLDLLQADLLSLPLKPASFDFIYSLGVLHHTPDPKQGLLNLVRLLKPSGKISITLYAGYNRVYMRSAERWRRLTTRLPRRAVYLLSTLAVPLYYLYRLPLIGAVGQGIFPISMHPKAAWRVLDTFDCYTPRYQSYHTHFEVFRWFQEAGLKEIRVLEPGISMQGTKP